MTIKSIESFISMIQHLKSSNIQFIVIGGSEDYQRGCNFDNKNTHHRIYLTILSSIGQFKYIESIALSDIERITDIKSKIASNIHLLPFKVEHSKFEFEIL